MTHANDALECGREAFKERRWKDAYIDLSAADDVEPLPLDDLELLAFSAFLIGRDDDCVETATRAYGDCLRLGDVRRAARSAFWVSFLLLNKGELAPAGGWLARARRLLDDLREDCVEEGFLLLPEALRSLAGGDAATSHAAFGKAFEIGKRFNDRDLMTMALHGQGQALIMMGDVPAGMALFDEAMVAVIADETSPIVAGSVYCGVLEACQQAYDFRRAQEWTTALTRWCDSQPQLVPYRGQCLVHRSEIKQMQGSWAEAVEEVRRACDHLSDRPDQPALGMAFYRLGELHRLRGDFDQAEEAYLQVSQLGGSPQPGLSQLWIAQGRLDAAVAAVRREVEEASGRVPRAQLLPAFVDILLAAEDVSAARSVADQLRRRHQPPYPSARCCRRPGAGSGIASRRRPSIGPRHAPRR